MIARQYYSCNEMRREGLTVFDPLPSIELILPMIFEDLGFKPVTLQVNEFLKQLKTGRKIAQENALTNFYNFGIHEFHHHARNWCCSQLR